MSEVVTDCFFVCPLKRLVKFGLTSRAIEEGDVLWPSSLGRFRERQTKRGGPGGCVVREPWRAAERPVGAGAARIAPRIGGVCVDRLQVSLKPRAARIDAKKMREEAARG
jgi:hypothetical protein